ncbi:MAG TPA: hypothetical protein VL522_17370 [Bordetella sp.]|nr:hypothetical protein [Bordetella sp.]
MDSIQPSSPVQPVNRIARVNQAQPVNPGLPENPDIPPKDPVPGPGKPPLGAPVPPEPARPDKGKGDGIQTPSPSVPDGGWVA